MNKAKRIKAILKVWQTLSGAGRQRSFDKMPAHAREIDQIDLFSVRLLSGFRNPDPELFRQFLCRDHRPELVSVADFYADHQVLRKFLVVILLQNKLAPILLKADVVAGIPIDPEPYFFE